MSSGAGREAPIAVLGAGSWGTALAIQFARAGRPPGCGAATRPTRGHARRAATALSARRQFPESLTVVERLAAALDGAASMSGRRAQSAFRALLAAVAPLLARHARRLGDQGIRAHTGKLPHQVAREVLGDAADGGAVGPDVRAGSGRGPAHRHDHRFAR